MYRCGRSFHGRVTHSYHPCNKSFPRAMLSPVMAQRWPRDPGQCHPDLKELPSYVGDRPTSIISTVGIEGAGSQTERDTSPFYPGALNDAHRTDEQVKV